MTYSTVIFDLDGTLLDTLDDLADAANTALTAHGYPARTREEVCAFVGNGVRRLIERAIPGGAENPDCEAVLADFKAAYSACCRNKTAPYPGIVGLLSRLRDGGVRIAVVSNKFDAAVRDLCAHYFGDLVPVAVGECDNVRKKPAPDAVFEALRRLGADASDAVYVGDSDVDILTARNAGLPCISVTWGFRTRGFLTAHGASVLTDSPDALYDLIQ